MNIIVPLPTFILLLSSSKHNYALTFAEPPAPDIAFNEYDC
ncbi:hypothetical protein [Bacillus coahuilensis]|nr:hypothetical protein [Bacillus coahuilensis]